MTDPIGKLLKIGEKTSLETRESVEVDYVLCNCGQILPFSQVVGENYVVCWCCRAAYHRFAADRMVEYLGFLCEGEGWHHWRRPDDGSTDTLVDLPSSHYQEKLFRVGEHWLCVRCALAAVKDAKAELRECKARVTSLEAVGELATKYAEKLKVARKREKGE